MVLQRLSEPEASGLRNALAALAVWVYLDWLKAGAAHETTGLCWMKERLLTKEAWRSRDLSKALLVGMLLGLCSFWNGAAVIGVLLILACFGLFSDGKLDYGVTTLWRWCFPFCRASSLFREAVCSLPFTLDFWRRTKASGAYSGICCRSADFISLDLGCCWCL